jgi:SAM-dependent methyltransferase
MVKALIKRGIYSLGYEIRRLNRRNDPIGDPIGGYLEATPSSRQLSSWGRGVIDEVDWWSKWFASRGEDWPDDFKWRQDPASPFEVSLLDDVTIKDLATARVLDVGAGPMTRLGKVYKGHTLDITAIDPLAPFYSALALKHGISRPVVTQQGFAEALSALFDPNTFDLAYCFNALDHSFDPLTGLEEMLLVTRVGGKVVLDHFENEAMGGYHGLHQWNFSERNGHFIIWNRADEIDVSARFASVATVQVTRIPDTYYAKDKIIVSFYKNSDLDIDLVKRHRTQVNDVLSAVLLAFYSANSLKP